MTTLIHNRLGARFEVLAHPGAGGDAVPAPYAGPEDFLATFTAAQRVEILRALGSTPGRSTVDHASLRNLRSDVAATALLVRLVRARQLAFRQPEAPSRRRAAVTAAAAAGAVVPREPPPQAPPPPPVREEVQCELLSVEAVCSHNGRKASRAGLLEVVPGRDHDRIRLTSHIRGGCGDHPRWEVRAPGASEPVKTGVNSSFVAKNWAFKTLWGVFEVMPRSYYVNCTCCSGPTKHLEVKAYPIDQWKITAEIDFKQNPLHWAWDVTLTTWEDLGGEDEGLKVKNEILHALTDKKKQLEWAFDKVLAPLVGSDTKWELFKTKIFFTGKWAEHTDHRAFYKYEATLKLDPIIKGEFTIPFGPTSAIPPWIKKWSTDLIGDLYLYLKFIGELSLQGRWGRSGPDEHEATASGEGKISVKVGGNLFLMKRGALNLDVNGGTFISAEAKAAVARKPAIEYDLKWGGLEIELTIEAAWGMVEYKRKWKAIDGCSLLEKTLGHKPEPWYPLGR